MAKTNMAEATRRHETGDAPLIDLNDASIKKLIARAKKRGYITYDELNEALPQDQMSSEQIEDVMSALSEMGVNIVENEEAGEDERARGRHADDEVDAGRRRRERRARRRDREEEGNRRSHRRSGAHVPARDGRGRAAQPRGRDRHRQAHRGRPRHDDPGPVRKPDHLQRDHRLVERAQRRHDAAARDPRSRRDAVEGPRARSTGRGCRGRRRGEISEKTAGPSFKEEDEAEEAPADEDEDDD